MHGLAQLRESINLPVSIELFDHEHSSPALDVPPSVVALRGE
jgi:hypothetical protein